MNDRIRTFYRIKADKYSLALTRISAKIKSYSWFRFFAFLFIILIPSAGILPVWISIALSGIFAVLFLYLVWANNEAEKSMKRLQVLLRICNDELMALDHRFSHFEPGNEFQEPGHPFVGDLDIFGEGSLFQFLNRAPTVSGKIQLAEWLKNPLTCQEVIRERQKAVMELADMSDWRLEFRATGTLFQETEEQIGEIQNWSSLELHLKKRKIVRMVIVVIPLLTLGALIYAIAGFSQVFLYFLIFSQWSILYFYRHRINQYYRFFGQKAQILEKYVQLLHHLESVKFTSGFLEKIRTSVTIPGPASTGFRKLRKLVKEFEYRQNMIVGFFLNSLFLWDIRCVYKLNGWHNEYKDRLNIWLRAVAETGAMICLGNYAYNHPQFTYPELRDSGFLFDAEGLGHPLLMPEKRICNDLKITESPKILIITGANMAGKSTFLRTAGVNVVLAELGAPVCAEKMIFTPVGVFTGMRTQDSLYRDESYFFAELLRLQNLLKRLRKGEKLLVILDEVLKGTNSEDKLNGSKELIRRLAGLDVIAMIATHDLKLGGLEQEFPGKVLNKSFEIRIENDEMIFDYILTDGITKTMNASFMMKKMGII